MKKLFISGEFEDAEWIDEDHVDLTNLPAVPVTRRSSRLPIVDQNHVPWE